MKYVFLWVFGVDIGIDLHAGHEMCIDRLLAKILCTLATESLVLYCVIVDPQ